MGNYFPYFLKQRAQMDELKKQNYICKIQLKRALQELRSIKKQDDQFPTSNFQFNLDMTAPNIENIRVVGNRIKMAGSTGQCYRASCLYPFPQTGIYTVTLRIIKYMNKYSIDLGLSTKSYKNQGWHPSKLKEIAYYASWQRGDGKCIIGGEQIQMKNIQYTHKGAIKGQQIEMVVNMNAMEISFTKKANKQRPEVRVQEMPLPVPFLNKSLYAYVQLHNYGDIVEII